MPSQKISQLPLTTTSTSPDLYTLVQTGNNYAITFANMQAALAAATMPSQLPTITLTGDVTGAASGGTIPTSIASATVTSKLLTGFTVGPNSSVLATDTILAAFGKIQGQLNNTISSAITALTGDVSATGPGSVSATVNSVGGKTASDIAAAITTVDAATSSNTPSTLVKRDGSGNFSAGTITATLSGNATGTASNITATSNSTLTTLSSLILPTSQLSGQVTLLQLPSIGSETVLANTTLGTATPTAVSLGTVTESISSVLTLSGWSNSTIGSPTIQVKQSSGSQSGYLSSTDWNTFNNKQTAGSYITALTGDVSASGPGSASASLIATSNGTLTTLSALTTASSLSSVGTITSGTWNGTTIAINHGGTGQTTASAAFNALSPITSTGDLILGTGVNTAGRLGIGSTGNVLTVSGGTATWAPPATSGTVTSVSVTSANGFAGTVATPTSTPAITISTTVNSPILAGNGTAISAATTTGSGSTAVLSSAPSITGAWTLTDAGSVVNASDATKQLAFSLSGMTTAKILTLASGQTTTQTLNIPNITATDTLATLGLTQTFNGACTFNASGTSLTVNKQALILGALGLIAASAVGHVAVNGTTNLVGTTQAAFLANMTSSSGATTAIYGFDSTITQAGSITTSLMAGFASNGITKGASSTLTRAVDFYINSGGTAGTNNASMSDNNTFTGNWFINQSGTTSSTFGGDVTLAGSGTGLTVNNNALISGTLQSNGNTFIADSASSQATIGASSSTAVHQVFGGQRGTINTVSSTTYTVDNTTTDYIIYTNSTANAIAITLPAPTSGRVLYVYDISGQGANHNITIKQHASETINGLTQVVISTAYGGYSLTTDGTNWFAKSVSVPGTPVTQTPNQANASGTSNASARADHVHNIPTGTPSSLTPNAGNSQGTAAAFAQQDHIHNVPTAAPANQTIAASASDGSAATFSRSDHLHTFSTAAASSQTPNQANASGTSTSFAKADHIHNIPTGTASTISTNSNTQGSASAFAQQDHTHQLTASSASTDGQPQYDGTNWQSVFPEAALNPGRAWSSFDDFLVGNIAGVTGGLNWAVTVSGGGSTVSSNTAQLDSNHPGITRITAGGGGGNTAGILLNSTNIIVLGGGTLTMEWLVQIVTLATVTNDYSFRCGIGDSATADFTNGVYFEYTRGTSTNWLLKTAAAGVRTTSTTTSTVTVGSWVKLGVVVNAAASSVSYYINGTLVGVSSGANPITTNIPTVATSFAANQTRTAGTPVGVDVDYFNVYQRFTTSR